MIRGPRWDKTCLGFANNKGAAQPEHPHRLISAFVICLLESMISELATSKFLCPRHYNGRGIVTPVRPYFMYLRTYIICTSRRHLLSKSNTFDQNFMKLGHIVKYVMSSSSLIIVYMAPCFKE